MSKQTEVCDVCGNSENITVGRWLFYCKKHKINDINKTLENEINDDYNNLEQLDYEVIEHLL